MLQLLLLHYMQVKVKKLSKITWIYAERNSIDGVGSKKKKKTTDEEETKYTIENCNVS